MTVQRVSEITYKRRRHGPGHRLDVEARLKLLRRMAFVRDLDRRLITQLDGVNLRAARLRDKRDELRRNRGIMEIRDGKPFSAVARGIDADSMRPLTAEHAER